MPTWKPFLFTFKSSRSILNMRSILTLLTLFLLAWPGSTQQTQWTGTEPLEGPTDHATHGIWLNYWDMMNHPTSGSAWTGMLGDVNTATYSAGAADVWNGNSDHDIRTMGYAMIAVRNGSAFGKGTVASALSTVATTALPAGTRWIDISRNLTGYTIAADVLKMDGTWAQEVWASQVLAYDEWLHDLLDGTTELDVNNGNERQVFGDTRTILPFASGSNAAAQEGLCYVAMAAYFDEVERLYYGWQRFRVYMGDLAYTVNNTYGPGIGVIRFDQGIASGWAGHDGSGVCQTPSFPPGNESPVNGSAVILGCPSLPFPASFEGGGIICNDMRRDGNEPAQWPPLAYTSYPWTGMEGMVPAAHIFHRFGYDGLNIGSGRAGQAVDAMARFSIDLAQSLTSTGPDVWWDFDRAENIKHLFSFHYDEANPGAYPYKTSVGMNKTIGFTDWTHPL